MTTTRWRDGEHVLISPDGKYWSVEQGDLEDEADAVRHLKWLARGCKPALEKDAA